MNKQKRAQIEIMGLALIVIIISIAALFVVRAVFMNQNSISTTTKYDTEKLTSTANISEIEKVNFFYEFSLQLAQTNPISTETMSKMLEKDLKKYIKGLVIIDFDMDE